MKKILPLLLLLITLFVSCSDDDNTPGNQATSVEEDQQNIENSVNQFYDCIQSYEAGELSQFILNTLIDASGDIDEAHIDMLLEQFDNQYGEAIINDRLQFSNRLGNYTWNATTSQWEQSANANKIVLSFPATEVTTTNDMEISFDSYSDTEVSFDAESIWLPSALSMSMKQNNVELASVTVSNITFDVNDNFSMPTNIEISILTAPFTHTINWSRNTPTEFNFEYGFQNGTDCKTQLFSTVVLQDSDYGNITSVEEDVKSVLGSVLHNDFRIEYSANVEQVSAIEEPTATEINTFIDAAVFYNNIKIGDLLYDEVNDEVEILIVFKNGTTQNVDIYVGDFVNQIETIFTEYIN